MQLIVLQVLGLTCDLIGVIIMARGFIFTNKTIEKIRHTTWGDIADKGPELYSNRKYTLIGLSLIIIGFVLQIISALSSFYKEVV